MERRFPLPDRHAEPRQSVLVLRMLRPLYPGFDIIMLTNSKQYIMDGYHVSHDPSVEFSVEPTTGRKLNILDVPDARRSRKDTSGSSASNRVEIVKGRALSPSQIQHPRPSRPHASRQIREDAYDIPTLEALNSRFGNVTLSDSDSDMSTSPPSSSGSSLSSRSSNTSPSSLSSLSDYESPCSCQRFGITRAGERVKIDCGGKRCGAFGLSDSDSTCSSDSDDDYQRARTHLRRENIRVRR